MSQSANLSAAKSSVSNLHYGLIFAVRAGSTVIISHKICGIIGRKAHLNENSVILWLSGSLFHRQNAVENMVIERSTDLFSEVGFKVVNYTYSRRNFYRMKLNLIW